ncbi:MAG: SH3 domain-containing protein [Caldilineaceae bacterium]
MRPAPTALVLQLGVGQRLSVVEGPISADGFIWWRVDDGQGTTGWAAQGDGADEWLSPVSGNDIVPVNRAPRVGDRVRVTMDAGQQLSVRNTPGTNAAVLTRVNTGQEFTILAGPQSADGFIWYQVRSDDGEIQGWAADGNDTTRWLSPLE